MAMRMLLPAIAAVLVMAAPINVSAKGGPPEFVIPPGSTATFSNVAFGACNNLTGGYELNGVAHDQWFFAGGCGSGAGSNVTIGPFATLQILRVYLRDNTCHFTYYSDGTPVDHVIVTGQGPNGFFPPYNLRYADAGGLCERTTATFNNFSGYNFKLDLNETLPPGEDEFDEFFDFGDDD
jgi:hypothetical protein